MRYTISRNGVFFPNNWLLLCQIAVFQHVGIKEKLKVVCARDYFAAAVLNLCTLPTSCLFYSLAKLSQWYHLLSTAQGEDRREVLMFVLTVLAPERFNRGYHRVLCPTRKSWQVNKAVLNVAPNKAAV